MDDVLRVGHAHMQRANGMVTIAALPFVTVIVARRRDVVPETLPEDPAIV